MPGLAALQDTEEVPDAARLSGVIGLQDMPAGIASLRFMVPENWLRALAVSVEFAMLFTLPITGEPEMIVKSCTV